MSQPFISFLVTCHNEGESLEKLLSLLSKYIDGNEIVILDDYSDEVKTLDIIEKFSKITGFVLVAHRLNKNYGEHKNFGNSHCKGKYIFQVDADELPNKILLDNLKNILEANPTTEMFYVPRINKFNGITEEDVKRWVWRTNEKGYINFPDYQSRIYQNRPNIKWNRKLHETVIGFGLFSKLPAEESFSLYHEKSIEKQRSDNERYNKEYSEEDNVRMSSR
jgi:glycosyltransferase involved in cell wall biosynthesis